MFPGHQPQPSYEERADVLRSEFDYRAPKLRLSIFAYFVENGMTPEIKVIDEIVKYISEHIDDYANDIATLGPVPSLEVIPFEDGEGTTNAYDDGGYV